MNLISSIFSDFAVWPYLISGLLYPTEHSVDWPGATVSLRRSKGRTTVPLQEIKVRIFISERIALYQTSFSAGKPYMASAPSRVYVTWFYLTSPWRLHKLLQCWNDRNLTSVLWNEGTKCLIVKLAKSKQKFTADILHINSKNSLLRSADGLLFLSSCNSAKSFVRSSQYIRLNIESVPFQLAPKYRTTLSRL